MLPNMSKKPKNSGLRDWPADNVERWPLEKIKPYPKNARTHSNEQIGLIADSIKKYGFTTPLLVDESGVLIFGHGRRAAAELLGLPDAPVSVARGWSEQDKNAYRIADNQIALRSGWDDVLLREQFHELKLEGYDVSLLGFDEGQMTSLLTLNPQQGVNDPLEHWQGMPSYDQADQTAHRTILVHFADDAAVEQFKQLVPDQPFTDKTKYVWFPSAPEDDVRDQEWVSDK